MTDSKIYKFLFSELSRNPKRERVADTAAAMIVEGDKYDIDPIRLLAVAYIESGLNPQAASPVGARGLMQMMPPTAVEMCGKLHITYVDGCEYDPVTNVRICSFYLHTLCTHYRGDWDAILTAYNRGPGNTDKILAKGAIPDNVLESYANLVNRKLYTLQNAYTNMPYSGNLA